MNYKLEHIILDLRQLFEDVSTGKYPYGTISSSSIQDNIKVTIEVSARE